MYVPERHIRGKAIGIHLRRPASINAESKYPDMPDPLFMAAGAGRWRKYNQIKGDKNMQKKRGKKQLSSILCIVLTVAMALCTNGCNGKADDASAEAVQQGEARQEDHAGDNVLGEGETQFEFTVVDQDGEETHFEIHTDKEIVGDALQEANLIEGEEGDYGLFVKTVNGITADYDKDGHYWAFYVNDEYAEKGVDSTEITEGDSYAFKVE